MQKQYFKYILFNFISWLKAVFDAINVYQCIEIIIVFIFFDVDQIKLGIFKERKKS